ncbi:MAG: TM0106 family RecB-like putative nuclease [Gammaproteobacteria bacterium]|nr:TM0106 family RecB-like putative nuclease [Gammaproteobacteria bacterium]
MQRHAHGQLLYSPSDLVTFLECSHATYLDVQHLIEPLARKKADTTRQFLRQRGIEHEQAYLQHLKDGGSHIHEIPAKRSLEARADLTLEAMQAGVDVIYQGAFLDEPWCGYADFLVKCETASSFGAYSYEVLDTKLAQTARPRHIVQLCMYSALLARLQDLRPAYMYLYSGAGKKQCFRVSDFFAYCSHARQNFENYMKNLPEDSYPVSCAHCSLCDWQEHCAARWETDDHLCRVANIRRSQTDKLHTAGIHTATQLAAMPEDSEIPGLNGQVLARLRSQAALQAKRAVTGKSRFEMISCPAEKGLARMPGPDPGDLFFDMEGDPLHPGGLEYLFGIHHMHGLEEAFEMFWAHNHAQEKQAFQDFMQFLDTHLEDHPHAHIYHYNHYETTALKRLSCRYAVCEEQLDALLRTQKFVDLYPVVRESIRTSEPGYSIKHLETFYMPERDSAVATAADSMLTYSRWRATREDDLLDEIAEYNQADCISTRLLRDWLLELRPADLPWPALQADTETERVQHDPEYAGRAELQAHLGNLQDESQALGTHLSHLLEFHKREAKPLWWSRFERQNKYEDELIDDTECLAGLQQTEAPETKWPYRTYTFKFPPQESKLKAGQTIVNARTLETAGIIIDLDETHNIVRIRKRADKGPLPACFSAGPERPIDNRGIRSAMYRCARHVISHHGHSHVASELLQRRIPRIRGKTAGQPIVDPPRTQAKVMQAASCLDHSYLFIQGPPGSGKTYVSAHIIVGLLKGGKKIGITSNSHKAIHNLLAQVTSIAGREQLRFRGVKKATRGSRETFFEDTSIINETRTEDVDLGANLFAGTAWLFSHVHLQGRLDYLFIDEAGQVPMANVMAMAMSTKNIILAGDRMQLAQPVQGIHPGESGLSVLEFLLGERSMVTPERGIFLDQTYRLVPGICSFVSEAFYEDQLMSHESALQRSLVLHDSDLPNEGIVMIAARHTGCSQKSVEEGEIVESRYMELLGQTFRDKDGSTRPIDMQDILVVTPYNVQVNHLRTLLPQGARVGTVDKFQGQEAAVVLISMVSSSAEDLPRNFEFLYSRNRLNVALSRAQCLAIVIASPKLLEVPCKTVEQMKLASIFCHLNDYAVHARPMGGREQVYYAP